MRLWPGPGTDFGRRRSPHHLVKTIEYVVPAALEQYRQVGAVRSKLLASPPRASTGVVADALRHLGMRIEVDAIAVLN